MITYSRAVAITPNDSTTFTTPLKVLIPGSSGTIKVDFVGIGTAITLQVIAGQQYPVNIKRVYATGTTATNIVGFY